MPRRFVDYLPGSAIPLAHMPKKRPRSHVPPQPDEHPPSERSEDGSSLVDQPPADPFETEPDSMGLFRIYPTRPTLFPPDDSNLSICCPGLQGSRPSKFPAFADSLDAKELSVVRASYVAVHVPVFTRPSRASRNFLLLVAHAHLRILVHTSFSTLDGYSSFWQCSQSKHCMSLIERFASDSVRPHAHGQGHSVQRCSSQVFHCIHNKHPDNIFLPWNLALQMHVLASSAFLGTQAVISSLPPLQSNFS
ncbi:hypothetical protein M405DRAFT_205626 [Rhizopogon salebrosus TDB-379]|nr:hypothetical protein M405DRAFT_205626 [Rhizopogon salebrosus TDB-379]